MCCRLLGKTSADASNAGTLLHAWPLMLQHLSQSQLLQEHWSPKDDSQQALLQLLGQILSMQ